MKRKIIIVDEQDNIKGHKEPGTLKKEDIYRVSALWITNTKEDILLAKRAVTKSHDPGKWGPAVAGTIEEGETYDENIIKEAEEELGLTNITPKKSKKIRIYSEYTYFCQWYKLTLDKKIEDFTIQEKEVAEIKWFSHEELKKETQVHPDMFLKSIRQEIEQGVIF